MTKEVPHLAIDLPREKIVAFCKKWKIQELSFFGSIVSGDFNPNSDIDALVQYSIHAERSLFRRVEAQEELAQILGRPVDLVSKAAIEKSTNEFRRQEILDRAKIYYSDEEAA